MLGKIKAGEWLRQDDLAARFGVSSTPVREALRILEAQGLVIHEPHRGVRVADIRGTAEQFYKLRAALESAAVELAVPRMTAEIMKRLWEAVEAMETADAANDKEAIQEAHHRFHLELYSAADFPMLFDMIQVVWTRFPWDVWLGLQERPRPLLHDHRRIAEQLQRGDKDGAIASLRTHLQSLERMVVARSRAEEGSAKPDP